MKCGLFKRIPKTKTSILNIINTFTHKIFISILLYYYLKYFAILTKSYLQLKTKLYTLKTSLLYLICKYFKSQ